MKRIIFGLSLAVSAIGAAYGADVTTGYLSGPGGFYNPANRSGPYAVDANGTGVLIGRPDTVIQGAAVFRGGTIAAGGTAQSLMAANTTRRGFVIQNQSSAALYIKIGGAAATPDFNSMQVAAGAMYTTPPQHVSTGAISIYGATTGQAFYAVEF